MVESKERKEIQYTLLLKSCPFLYSAFTIEIGQKFLDMQ